MDYTKEYTVIVQRLCYNTRLKTAERIKKDFDIPLFTQMVEHNAFDGNSMLGLVNTTFGWIHNLHCPKRDEECARAKQRVMQCTTMRDVVPLFLKEVNKCLDYMDEDMKEFMQYKDHPVMHETLRRMMQ
jgi:hypothetical protein